MWAVLVLLSAILAVCGGLGCSFGCCTILRWSCVCMMAVSVFCVCWWFGVLVGLHVLPGLDRSLGFVSLGWGDGF